MTRTRLGPTEWCDAALDAIAAGGVQAVVVEQVARRLGVSKGSFYWHFPNRDALLFAAVNRWEQIRIDEAIPVLAAVEDPADRLRQLFEGAFGRPRAGKIEAAFMTSRDDPLIAPVLRRVTRRRMAFLVQLFTELGFPKREASHRARVVYGTYLGLFVVRYANPSAVPASAGPLDAFLAELVALVTRPV